MEREIEQMIANVEQAYSTVFSESYVKNDLRDRTYKRDFYIQAFNKYSGLGNFLKILESRYPQNLGLISRCKKCIDHTNKMLEIVRNF